MSDQIAAPAESAVSDEPPVLQFPRFIALPENSLYAGSEIGGVRFDDAGHSERPVAFNRVMAISGGFAIVTDLATGIELSPIYAGKRFEVEWSSRFWTDLQPLPEHVEQQREQIRARFEGKARTPAAGETPAREQARVASEIDLIVAAIGELEPGNEDHWTVGGKPDATVLSARLGFTVTAALRDRAHAAYVEANQTPRDVLNALLKAKGARYLRQVAENRGIDVPRSGDGIVERLAEVLSLADARAL